MNWFLKPYYDLTLDEFHAIIKLRISVFVIEQNCPYPELDDKDKMAYHFYGINNNNKIIAYSRIFKPGDFYDEAAFGRVVVDLDFRNQNLGRELVKRTIDEMLKLAGKTTIKIGAQTYLKKFYTSFGFQQDGEEYIEDNIPHIHMIKKYK